MIFRTKNNKQIAIRKLCTGDFDDLFNYLQKLSEVTKKRFGPHPFDKESIICFYRDASNTGYIAVDPVTSEIVGYSIIKTGFLEHDHSRLQSYGLTPHSRSDCTFAPSVADSWQSCGIGDALFGFILTDLGQAGVRRIILWGGVQADNEKAVKYYQKHGFRKLGQFQHNGENVDMILEII